MLKPVRLSAKCYDKHFAIFNCIWNSITKTGRTYPPISPACFYSFMRKENVVRN